MVSVTLERKWGRLHGVRLVAGVDEAGRGPLAGPVVAAAVVFDLTRPRPKGLDDSKKLDAATRSRLSEEIRGTALSYAIACATPREIDAINILEATRLAARRALRALSVQAEAIVSDALTIPGETRPVHAIIKGDARSASIAAASILAKVHRDALMDNWHSEFPDYGWETGRGYPTKFHYRALESHGPTTIHRLTFAGVGFFPTELRWSRTGAALRERRARGEDAACIRAEVSRLGDLLPEDESAALFG